MLVKQRMSHPVITVHPETNMQDALELMRKEHIRRLPVVNRRGQLVGIVSETDLLKASPSEATSLSVWEVRELLRKVKIEEIMTHEVVTVNGSTPLEEAARIMADSKISGLPVLEEGKLVGLITETDLFKTFLEMFGARTPGVRLMVLVPKGPGQLARLTKAIFDLGGDIIAMVSFEGENSETGTITFKVAGVQRDALVDAITPTVIKVLDVREIS
jgi:acetoin utilization protein AcuB